MISRNSLLTILVTILITAVVSVSITAGFVYWFRRPVAANYDAAYIEEARGQVLIEIPEMFELANIAIALTDYGLTSGHAVQRSGEYYQRVMAHFMPHKDHPLIAAIEFDPDDPYRRYYGFRENSARYRFDGDRLVRSAIYRHKWGGWPDIFSGNRRLVEDFARASGFRSFYRENRAFYAQQIETYRKRAPIRTMWTWLEERFPQRYDAYKVVFSPLVGGSHSTERCSGKGFSETIMFVSGAGVPAEPFDKVREGLLSRVVFTEIDHNYVNPTADLFARRVRRAFANLDGWNTQRGYRNAEMTFNEYMTWAVFLLYADDVYEDADLEQIRRITIDKMAKGRGFIRFEAFAGALLDLYRSAGQGTPIPEFYPPILAWAESIPQ